jgi:hypothetical protein
MPILKELFYYKNEKNKNHTDKNEEIYLYCYILGVKKLVNLKSTYPFFKNKKDLEEYSLFYAKKYSSNIIAFPFTIRKK